MSNISFRVLRAQQKFIGWYGLSPDEIFLGPKERMELDALLKTMPSFPNGRQDIPPEFMGMTVIGLASDGVRVGTTEAAP